jgi:hypothetical protein
MARNGESLTKQYNHSQKKTIHLNFPLLSPKKDNTPKLSTQTNIYIYIYCTHFLACCTTMGERELTGVAQSSAHAFNFRFKVIFSISLRIANCRISVCVKTAALSASSTAISSRIALPVSTISCAFKPVYPKDSMERAKARFASSMTGAIGYSVSSKSNVNNPSVLLRRDDSDCVVVVEEDEDDAPPLLLLLLLVLLWRLLRTNERPGRVAVGKKAVTALAHKRRDAPSTLIVRSICCCVM